MKLSITMTADGGCTARFGNGAPMRFTAIRERLWRFDDHDVIFDPLLALRRFDGRKDKAMLYAVAMQIVAAMTYDNGYNAITSLDGETLERYGWDREGAAERVALRWLGREQW